MNPLFVFLEHLRLQWKLKHFLCVGIDPDEKDVARVFGHFNMTTLLAYCKMIVDATPNAACYKLNYAFFECWGWQGMLVMEKIVSCIKQKNNMAIGDAKKGDIDNTSARYARAAKYFGFDAITVSPYMGTDTVKPFYDAGLFSFVLVRTTNGSASDIQELEVGTSFASTVKDEVIKSMVEKFPGGCGFVIGAVKTNWDPSHNAFITAAKYPENNFNLIPGVGAQGGELALTVSCAYDKKTEGGFIVNVSRGLIPKECTKENFGLLVSQNADSLNKNILEALELVKSPTPVV